MSSLSRRRKGRRIVVRVVAETRETRARVQVVGTEHSARVQTQSRTQKMRSRWCLHTNARAGQGRGRVVVTGTAGAGTGLSRVTIS
jgi:hypothetical protein